MAQTTRRRQGTESQHFDILHSRNMRALPIPRRSVRSRQLCVIIHMEHAIHGKVGTRSRVRRYEFHACMFGSKRNKHTCFLANEMAFEAMRKQCDGNRSHEPWGMRWQKGWPLAIAEKCEYPVDLCKAIAEVAATAANTTALDAPPSRRRQKTRVAVPQLRERAGVGRRPKGQSYQNTNNRGYTFAASSPARLNRPSRYHAGWTSQSLCTTKDTMKSHCPKEPRSCAHLPSPLQTMDNARVPARNPPHWRSTYRGPTKNTSS